MSRTKEIAIIRFLETLATTNTLGTIVYSIYSSNILKIPLDIYYFISVTVSEQPSIRLDDADAILHIGTCKCIHTYYILTMYREEAAYNILYKHCVHKIICTCMYMYKNTLTMQLT